MSYNTQKFGYSNNKGFSLSGDYYTGYYNILSGVVYKGKRDRLEKLVVNSTYFSDVVVSELLFDRAAKDTLSLPFNNISIPPNEFVTARVLNDILYKINYNNIYLYSKCFITSNLIPNAHLASIGVVSPSFDLDYIAGNSVTPGSFVALSANSTYIELGRTKSSSIALYDQDYYTIYACSSSTLTVLTGSFADASVALGGLTDLIRTDLNNTQKFSNIQDCVSYKNLLYIVDKGNSSIYKYDVKELQDSLSLNRRIYVESVGKQFSNRNAFQSPTLLTVDSINERLVIYDEQTKLFTVTDLDFNIFRSLKLLKRNETLQAIQYNNFYDRFYTISSIKNILYFAVFDANFNKIDSIQLTETLYTGEVIKRLKFAENNSNIFYIATNYRVLKKILSDPTKEIGIFLTEKMKLAPATSVVQDFNAPTNYCGFDIAGTDTKNDIVILQTPGRIMLFEEDNSFATVSFSNTLSNYNYNTFKFYNDEFVQANYINKELYKILKNILILKNDIAGKFTLQPATSSTFIKTVSGISYNSTMVLNGYTYISDYNYLTLDANAYNFFIHENERVTPLAINRCLNNLYNLQVKLLDTAQVYLTNSLVQYLSGTSTVYSPLVLA